MNHPHEDDELDRALVELWRAADAGTRAPADFDTRLFARLEREAPRVAASAADVAMAAWSLPALPWWVRAAGERHVALALLGLGTLVAWPAWWLAGAVSAGAGGASLARSFEQALTSTVTPLLPALFAPLAAPRVAMITAACLAPAIAWASYRLALAAERWTSRAAHGKSLRARHA